MSKDLEKIKRIKRKILFYQKHPKGAENWIEDHVYGYVTNVTTGESYWCSLKHLPTEKHPVTGRSYKQMWEWQKRNVIRPATARDKHGFMKYHTVALCTQRGEGKTFLNALLILHRFFTQLKQLIVLGSNSRDQSKFAMYDTLRDIIVNSPKLIGILGYENIREKQISLRDSNDQVVSSIRSVSAFSGILSNITAYNFTELFQQKNPGFFNQLDSSRRNIPNAQGYVDSTVSEKGHTLHRLYEASKLRSGKDTGILFVYRCSPKGEHTDFLHPNMTQKQLESFKTKFISTDFARFFKNTWELEDTSVFTPSVIRSLRYSGFQGQLGMQPQIVAACRRIIALENQQIKDPLRDNTSVIKTMESDLMPLPYKLHEDFQPKSANVFDLETLSGIYDTQWALGVGIDLADPLKDDLTKGARTIVTLIAKGLPGSKSNPSLHLDAGEAKVRYIYFVLHLIHIENNEIADILFALENMLYEFGSLQTLCVERWGAAGLRAFCEENFIQLELISPTYEKQRTGFNDLYTTIKTGFFKLPPTMVPGSKDEDIVAEELEAFRHDVVKKWYGSLTKKNPRGVQDDVMFSFCWGLFGLRDLTPDDFGIQTTNIFMGAVLNDTSSLMGDYKDR